LKIDIHLFVYFAYVANSLRNYKKTLKTEWKKQ